jgi:hypothetical protein
MEVQPGDESKFHPWYMAKITGQVLDLPGF